MFIICVMNFRDSIRDKIDLLDNKNFKIIF